MIFYVPEFVIVSPIESVAYGFKNRSAAVNAEIIRIAAVAEIRHISAGVITCVSDGNSGTGSRFSVGNNAVIDDEVMQIFRGHQAGKFKPAAAIVYIENIIDKTESVTTGIFVSVILRVKNPAICPVVFDVNV